MARAKRVPVVLQMSAADCGAACLTMLVRYWGGSATISSCQAAMGGSQNGVSALMIVQAARAMDFEVQAFRHTIQGLAQTPLPAIVHWQGVHFVVLEAWSEQTVQIVDPAVGRRSLTMEEFRAGYSGVTLTLQPGAHFVAQSSGKAQNAALATWLGYLRRVSHVPGSRRLFMQLILASLLYQVVGLTLPAVLWLGVERLLPGENSQLLTWLAIGMVGAVLAQIAVSYARAVLVIRLQQQLDQHLIPAFFAHLLHLPYSFFQQRSSGDLIARLEGNRIIRELILSGALTGLLDGGLTLLYLVLLYSQSPRFGLTVTVIALAQFFLLARTGERVHELSQLLLTTQAEEESFAVQLLRGIETVKAAGSEEWILAQWQSRFSATLQMSIVRGLYVARVQSIVQGLSLATPLILLWLGVGAVESGQLSLGQMLALVVLAASTLAPLSNLADHLHRSQQIWAHLERLDDVWETQPEAPASIAAADSQPSVLTLRGGIEIVDLSFHYGAAGHFGLRNLTFQITPGEKVAIVGETGAGKSTLVRLLLGLYRPQQGRITFDGYGIDEIGLSRLRQTIGVVLQDSFLLSGTIRENIALHKPHLPLAQVIAAAKLAMIHEEILRLPMSYETRVGEGGSGLSGGQRQRLALARALAIEPAILILDEATSHLDAQTERAIQLAIEKLQMTQIIIAHRLSTVRNVDRVLVLKAGRLVESGSPSLLATQNGSFQHLLADAAG
ncbi:MAG: peptidase domain-containing ABC transporter [Caldilineaceae bacterium]